MRQAIAIIVATLGVLLSPGAAAADPPRVRLSTSLGAIVVELYPERAPLSTQNFLAYVQSGFYDGTLFHRVIDGFMVQGGGFDAQMRQRRTRAPIRNESNNRESNRRGTIAMARTGDPHSATSQFFINLVDNDFLDYAAQASGQWGYAVFGEVVAGIEVVDAIAQVATDTVRGHQNVPVQPVVLEKATIEENQDDQ